MPYPAWPVPNPGSDVYQQELKPSRGVFTVSLPGSLLGLILVLLRVNVLQSDVT